MIELLIERLRWPAPLVRERAAARIGTLIAGGDDLALDALLTWIARQELESLAAVGLHPLIYALKVDRSYLPNVERVANSCKASSLLSELLLTHYDPTYEPQLTNCRHSAVSFDSLNSNASNGYDPASPIRSYLRDDLERVGQQLDIPLERQFDSEVAQLRATHGWSSASAFNASRSGYYGRHPGWSPLASEVLRTAYHRSVSYGASQVGADSEWLRVAAASESPIDLGLWRLLPGDRPHWWPSPRPTDRQSEVDVEVADVLAQIEGATRTWDSEHDVVLAASGCIAQSINGQHELDVRSFIQQPQGPVSPSPDEIIDLVQTAYAGVIPKHTPLQFDGTVESESSPTLLADWIIGACSGTAYPISLHFWQGWRRIRGIQCPASLLSSGPIEVVCKEKSLDFLGAEGLVAQWRDWTSDMSALFIEGLRPSSGWILTAPRDIVARVESETGGQFARCWRLKSYFREHGHGEFTEHTTPGVVGTSRIIRP